MIKKFRLGQWLLMMLLCATVPVLAEEEGGSDKTQKSEYLDLKPSFIANYGGPGPIHFLKVDITLRLNKMEKAPQLVDHHMPYIRHVLVMLLSRQTDDTIGSMEGKEKLRADALAAVQKVIQDEEGEQLVDDLLFTNFVVQR